MKKSFMNNLRNFVDSNVRHRIDRVSQNSGNIGGSSDPLNDDLLLVEHHFDDIQAFCVEAEKKISNMLQSIQLSSTAPSNLSAYTHNVQAGFNNLSHNIAQQAANITSSASSISAFANSATHENQFKNLTNKESKSTLHAPNLSNTQQYSSSDSLREGIQSCSIINRFTSLDQHSLTEHCLSEGILQRYKKLPTVGFYKFLSKSSKKLKQNSLLGITLAHHMRLQAQLTNLHLTYEQKIDSQCLKVIQHMLEADIPGVLKLKKTFLKAHNDLESLKAKYSGASQKQQQQQQATTAGHFANTSYLISQNSIQQGNKLEQLKNELDEAVTKFEQARDVYEAELFGFVCKEPELVDLMVRFYQLQQEYHQRVSSTIQSSSPALCDTLARTPRKYAFGTPIEEHLRCTGRTISPVIELCTHFLHLRALKEEGLFRIPGSSIKIKKLKNGINAWFVTLMNLDGLQSGEQRQTGHTCIVALHDLFKNAIGQRPQLGQDQIDIQEGLSKGSPACEDSTPVRTAHLSTSNNDSHPMENDHDDYILDLHSIAGLLKLYLRELPEPLFTYALYDDWIGCIANENDSPNGRLEGLANIMRQLPRANYENLKHLIKFLNRLTLFQEQNKMTSTNLAIAMAPSLIWSGPASSKEQARLNNSVSSSDDAQSLNLQMCSFGLSASQHATIIEALINGADQLFPEPSDYTLSEFPNLTLKSGQVSKTASSRAITGRSVKSTSPTGLSTASSSSFSSNASNSTASSAANRGHSRKGGSMEGLLGGPPDGKTVMPLNMSVRSIGRPASVQIRQCDYTSLVKQINQNHPPTKPPCPTERSQSRLTTIESPHAPSSHKPRAPPVPPPTSIRHQQERLKASGILPSIAPSNQEGRVPRPMSLRGTGTLNAVSAGHSSSSQTAATLTTRPSVPPPQRPATASVLASNTTNSAIPDRKCKSADDSDANCSHRLANSDNMRGDFEDTSGNEAEEIDLSTQSNSPVVSLDSISGDSSFEYENDKTSLDRSWTKCFKTKETAEHDELESRSGTLKLIDRDLAANQEAEPLPPQQPPSSYKSSARTTVVDDGTNADEPPAPVKPPRSVSPKTTQSTPL